MTKSTGARNRRRICSDQLKIQGCDRLFTVPGESFLAVLDALHDTPEIETIVCRQEGGVAYMADAARQDDGRPRHRLRHSRPGAPPTPAPESTSPSRIRPRRSSSSATSRAATGTAKASRDDFPASSRRSPMVRAGTEDARRIPEYVARAWRIATVGRPGPVVLALPGGHASRRGRGLPIARRPPLAEVRIPAQCRPCSSFSKQAAAPVAIVGGADWSLRAVHHLRHFAIATQFRSLRRSARQDASATLARSMPSNLGDTARPEAATAHSATPISSSPSAPGWGKPRRRVHADHARASGPDAGPRPPRSQRARPGLSGRFADLRRHGRVRRDDRRVDRPGLRPLLLRRAGASRVARAGATPIRGRG